MTIKEKIFLEYLNKNQIINFSKLRRITNSTRFQTENMLVNFLSLDIIEQDYLSNGIFYTLKNQELDKLLSDR